MVLRLAYLGVANAFAVLRVLPHKKRNHIRQLEALGYTVTLEPAA